MSRLVKNVFEHPVYRNFGQPESICNNEHFKLNICVESEKEYLHLIAQTLRNPLGN